MKKTYIIGFVVIVLLGVLLFSGGRDKLVGETILVSSFTSNGVETGKILLQVESRGEAWYLNPSDGKRYYMKDGEQAYQIMRFLSLGITNTDLRKIAVGEFE